ncbi:DUF3306 domain-containing protein [Amphritea sp. HPY]|uniref:DUF3306 domain-containing protein n=1 Tax=Amphritea sp. HPY TaxID=3421652 RepID=UPI003D7D4D26
MNDETFLSRWSRRKAEQPSAANEEAEAKYKSPPEQEPQAVAPISVEMTNEISATAGNSDSLPDKNSDNDEPIPLTDADMPAIESLSEESDYSQFLSSGVSDELRNLALRKLFNLPQFNIVDGLNDYDEDFSKMPALSQEVVARMRSWLQDKQEQVVNEMTGANSEESAKESSEKSSQERPAENTEKITDPLKQNSALESAELSTAAAEIYEEDPLGDADLEG